MKIAQGILMIFTALPLAGGCGRPVGDNQAADVLKPVQQAIFNGQPIAEQSNAGFLGVPQILVPGAACSAVVYNKYWLITAAHCFEVGEDPEDDYVYWKTAIPDSVARFLQTSATNGAGQLNILAGFRSPDVEQDTAMVLLDPTSAGVYMPTLQAQTTAPMRYSNGHLVIYGSSNASLEGTSTVQAYGWGFTGFNGSGNTYNGSLNRAWKNVDSSDSLYYYESAFNNAGTGCHGDSGGPDFWWDGGGFQLTGIHGSAPTDLCNGEPGGRNNGAEAFRTWVKNTAATLPMNGSLAPEELWPANNASDYNPSTSYSSLSFPSSTNDRGGTAIWLQTYLATPGAVNRVNLRARCASYHPCVKNGFPVRYNVEVWNGAWNSSGTFTQQPDGLGVVSLSIPPVNDATAVRVIPLQLGTDTNGIYYFQMAELNPANDQ
jgi:Trypsin